MGLQLQDTTKQEVMRSQRDQARLRQPQSIADGDGRGGGSGWELSKSEVRNSLGISGLWGASGELGGAGEASPRGFPCRRTKGASSSSAGRSRSWLSLRSSRVISGRWAKPLGTEVRRLRGKLGDSAAGWRPD